MEQTTSNKNTIEEVENFDTSNTNQEDIENKDVKTINSKLPKDVIEVLETLCSDESVSPLFRNNLLQIVEKLFEIHEASMKADGSSNIDKLHMTLSNNWQDNIEINMLYAQRAMKWLKIINLSDDNSVITFFNRLVDLGKILSEDNSHVNGFNNSGLTKEEAMKKRSELTSHKDSLSILGNKGHYLHDGLLSQLHELNEIISNS